MKKLKLTAILIVILLISSSCVKAANPNTDIALNSITSDEIAEEISYLANEELEGRRSQTEGNRIAGKFIAEKLAILKLKPIDGDYFQEFKFKNINGYEKLKLQLERMEELGYSVPAGGRNIVGILEGSGKKDEYIILTAHYDHMGTNPNRITGKVETHPGADDNASGTAALIEIAEAFTILAERGARPQRSIIFLFTDAEEWGLLGSQYFAENSPVSLENIVAVINMDMLGRNESSTLEVIATPLIADAETKNPDLFRVTREVAESLNLKIYLPTQKGRVEQVFYRSDHFSFFNISPTDNRIPVIFYTAGLHADYHTSRDTSDRINNKKVQKIAQFIFIVALKVAEMENAPDYIE